jgi:spore coat protein U-like protein
MPKTGPVAPIAVLAALALAAPAHAQTVNGIQSCVVSAQPVVFGTVTENAAVNTVGSIVLICQGGGNEKAFTVALSQGVSNSFLPRHMHNLNLSGRQLDYNLYLNAAHTQVWGNGQGSTQLFLGTLDFNGFRSQEATATLPVFARVPAQRGLTQGVYADQIIVTVSF